ncbi:MAG: NAD(P)/FAD-dependent oxidoreductase, partial [Nitrospirae bacterium]|nr:NAD(P)/FAD-dependent oxidoreductase [Fimbriimonadaceae bacterium]
TILTATSINPSSSSNPSDAPRGDVLVVGGGAAGIVAAWRAASLGARVILLEKTPRLGTKISISGGGKGNITHEGTIEDVLKGFRRDEARFLRPAMYRWTNRQMVDLLVARGLKVYTRPDGRIFPVDQTAKDVVAILASLLEEVGVDVRLRTPVTGLVLESGGAAGVRVGEDALLAPSVVVSTGGSSYPNSGTTGDGWRWAREAGHTIVPVRAALAPIYLKTTEDWAELSGVALRDVVLKARVQGREADRWRGDLLFTHQGLSGPCALEVSRVVAERMIAEEITLAVDLIPDQPSDRFAESLHAQAIAAPKRGARSLIESLLPERLHDRLLADARLPE